jgi:hypothetical protein
VAVEFNVPIDRGDLVKTVAVFDPIDRGALARTVVAFDPIDPDVRVKMAAVFVRIDRCDLTIDQAVQDKAAVANGGRATIGDNGPKIIAPIESPMATETAGEIGVPIIGRTFGITGTTNGTTTITGSTMVGGTTIIGIVPSMTTSTIGVGRRGR